MSLSEKHKNSESGLGDIGENLNGHMPKATPRELAQARTP